jgi:cysteine synthase B
MSQRKPEKVNLSEYPLLQIIGQTPLAKIDLFADELPNVEIYAKIETYNPGGSIKDRPVLRMLTEAIASGELTREKVILDSSSGNAGIAYAMIGAALGYKVELVIPNNASEERKKRIHSHSAKIIYTDAILGYDEALREVDRRYEAHPEKYFFKSQYERSIGVMKHTQRSISSNRNTRMKIIGVRITRPQVLRSGIRRVVKSRILSRGSERVVPLLVSVSG